MLIVKNISRIFSHKHGKITALKNISLNIPQGEFLSITGPSGSGKSTLLLTLGGMLAPTEGIVKWDDCNIYHWDAGSRAEWRSRTIGFVFQSFCLIPYLTVYENVSIGLSLSGRKENRDEVLKILDDMKLSDRLEHLPAELSIGQQQRVALARALVKKPEVILADEPTGNLDTGTSLEVLDIFQKINKQGVTVVLITHHPDIARMAHNSIKIIDGIIV